MMDEIESCVNYACTTDGNRDHGCSVTILLRPYVTDVVEKILTTLHADESAFLTAIWKEHVELKFRDNTVDVSRGWWHRLRAPSLAAFCDVDVGGEALRDKCQVDIGLHGERSSFLKKRVSLDFSAKKLCTLFRLFHFARKRSKLLSMWRGQAVLRTATLRRCWRRWRPCERWPAFDTVRPIKEAIVAVMQFTPQEHTQQRIAKKSVHFFLPLVMEEILQTCSLHMSAVKNVSRN